MKDLAIQNICTSFYMVYSIDCLVISIITFNPSTTRFYNIQNICVTKNKINLKVKLEELVKATCKLKYLIHKETIKNMNGNKNNIILKQDKAHKLQQLH